RREVSSKTNAQVSPSAPSVPMARHATRIAIARSRLKAFVTPLARPLWHLTRVAALRLLIWTYPLGPAAQAPASESLPPTAARSTIPQIAEISARPEGPRAQE